MSTPTPDDLEKFVHRTLRQQPPLNAPSSLEQRVLARLAAQSPAVSGTSAFKKRTLWAEWPFAMKGLFLGASALTAVAVSQIALAVKNHLAAGAVTALDQPAQTLSALDAVFDFASTMINAIRVLVGAVPPLWLYGGLAALVAGYSLLFCLGSFALHALKPTHEASSSQHPFLT